MWSDIARRIYSRERRSGKRRETEGHEGEVRTQAEPGSGYLYQPAKGSTFSICWILARVKVCQGVIIASKRSLSLALIRRSAQRTLATGGLFHFCGHVGDSATPCTRQPTGGTGDVCLTVRTAIFPGPKPHEITFVNRGSQSVHCAAEAGSTC